MTVCVKIKGRKRKLCIGDLDRQITLSDRNITTTSVAVPEFGEAFTDPTLVWSMLETTNGVKVFDGINIERIATHLFYIRYRDNITQEKFVFFEGNIYDIINTQDLEERHEWILLKCALNGDEAKASSFA